MNKLIVRKNVSKDYVQFTCRIENQILTKIRQIVNENNLYSVNSFINECLEFAINNIEIDNQN